MALIICPKCGKQVSDKAQECPHCSYSISSYLKRRGVNNNQSTNSKKNDLSKILIIGMIVIGIVLISLMFFLLSKNENAKNNIKSTHDEIHVIENNISNVDDGYKEEVELFGISGTIVYENTLSLGNAITNTATWKPHTDQDVETIYEDIEMLYGSPVDESNTYWTWKEADDQYRIVLQHYEDLGVRLVIQKE